MTAMSPALFRGMVIGSAVAGYAGLAANLVLIPMSEGAAAECDLVAKCIASLGGILLMEIVYLVTLVGLILFKWWARPLFLAFTGVWLVITPFLGENISAGPADAFYSISAMLDGAVIAAAYWSSISDRYIRTEGQDDAHLEGAV